jgi:hypothetical protein
MVLMSSTLLSSVTRLGVLAFLLGTVAACSPGRASVWVENRSSQRATIFVTDNSDQPAAWYLVAPSTTAHLGSGGLTISPDVRVNLIGWRHEADGVDACSPGDYQDTLYAVPAGASVKLLIEPNGRPSVSLAPEPSALAHLPAAPDGTSC